MDTTSGLYRPDGERERGLVLVLGPANSGKMGYALGWWLSRLSWRPILVTPTGPDAQALTLEMARRAGTLIGQSPALTFDGLVRMILGRPLRVPGVFEHALLMSRLLRQTPLRSLGHVSSFPGTASALAVLLAQLGESGRTNEEIGTILNLWARVDPDVSELADDIRRLSEAYLATCRELNLTDRANAVSEALHNSQVWTRPVAFYGFNSFTSGQRALIKALSLGTQVLVALPYETSRLVSMATFGEIEEWKNAADKVVELAPRFRAYSSPSIAYLERYFMEDPPLSGPTPMVSGNEGIRFLLASGQRNEAELVAQHISGLIKDGFRPGDIAVIVRRTRSWSMLLGQVFDSCGIPYQVDERRLLKDTGLGYAFLNLVKGAAHDDAEAFLAYLHSPYSGFSPEWVSDLEFCYLRGTLRGTRILLDLGQEMYPGSLDLLQALIPADASLTCGDADCLKRLAVHMLNSAMCGVNPDPDEISEDAEAFRTITAALSALPDLATSGLGIESLGLDTVMAALAGTPVQGNWWADIDAVQILSAHRARARRFAVVAILGLVEGEFPGGPDEPSLLSVTQRARLDSLGGGGLLAPASDREAALFVSAVSRAWQVLLLSARDADDGGGEAVPSHFWTLSKRLLAVGATEHDRRTLADVVFPAEKACSLRHYLRACAANGLSPHSSAVSHVSDSARATGRERFRVGSPPRLSDPAVLEDLSALQSFSPSSLEQYLGCPSAWFIERVVGMDEAAGLDGRMMGQLLHGALSATYRMLAERDLLPLAVDSLDEAKRVVDGFIDEAVSGDNCPGNLADRRLAAWRLKAMAQTVFEMEVEAGPSLRTVATEAPVGGQTGIDIGGLKIKGRIDRIDASSHGRRLFILDYKSGSLPAPSAIGTERGLQLPLYLMGLAAEYPDAQIIGGSYLSPSARQRSGVVLAGAEELLGSGAEGCRVLDQAAFADLFEEARGIAMAAAEGMRAGIITPPISRRCPVWCGLGPVCRARTGGYRP